MQTYRYNTSKNKILYVILLHWHLIALKCITAMLYVAPLVSLCERLVMLSMYDRQWDIFARRDNRTMQQQRQQQKEKKNRQQHKAATAMAIAIESVSMIALKYFIRMVDLHWFVHVYHFFLFHFFNVIFLHIHYLIGLETVRGERAWKKCGHVKFYCQPNNVYTNKLCYNSLSFFYSFNAVEG